MPTKLSPYSIAEVARGRIYIANLDLSGKERFCDEIAATQPIMLAHVLAPALEFGAYEETEHVIHVLLVLYRVFVHAPQKRLRQITEEDMEAVMQNNLAMFRLLEAESPCERDRITRLSAMAYPEINAFAFLIGYLNEQGFVQTTSKSKHCMLAAKNILDCFVKLKYEMKNPRMEQPEI